MLLTRTTALAWAALGGMIVATIVLLAWALLLPAAGKAPKGTSQVTYNPLTTSARPPTRALTKSDALLARLINAIDADMRSLQLGRWFLDSLRAQIPRGTVSCDNILDTFDYERIASAVPGINEIAKRETMRTLRALATRLVMEVCDTAVGSTTTGAQLLRVIDAYERSAFDPVDGILRGMPGYSESSRLSLPPPM